MDESDPTVAPKLQPNEMLDLPWVLSSDARYVAFNSRATNLAPNDTLEDDDGFVFDRDSGTIERVTADDDGTKIGHYLGDMSSDGRYVVFEGGQWLKAQVYVRDLVEGRTIVASVSNSGEEQDESPFTDGPEFVSMSADGRFVAFHSPASNLVSDDTNRALDIFVRDVVKGVTTRVSVSSSGEQTFWGVTDQSGPDISGNGRYVVFSSGSPELFSNPGASCEASAPPCTTQVFIHDRETGKTSLISMSSEGEASDRFSWRPSISYDGRYVTFDSHATNLDPTAKDGSVHSYLHDRETGKTTMVVATVYEGGVPVKGSARVSGTLVPMLAVCGEENVARDLITGAQRTLDGCPHGFSGDGRLIAFHSKGHIRLYDWTTGKSQPVL